MYEKTAQLHLLVLEDLTYIQSWEEWKKLWGETRLAEYRHALLHFGLKVPYHDGLVRSYGEQYIERLSFYLTVADGHSAGSSYFLRPGETIPSHWPSFQTALGRFQGEREICQALAQRAFQVLCADFFKRETRSGYDESRNFLDLVRREDLLQKLVWFLRPWEYGPFFNKPDSPRDHLTIHFMDFVSDLCDAAWGVRRPNNYPLNSRDDAALIAARPRLLRMFGVLGRLGELLGDEFPLNFACWKELFRMAKHVGVWLPGLASASRVLRLPKSLEEAMVGGSEPARVLYLLLAIAREKRRFAKLAEIERQQRGLRREAEQLR